MKQPVIFLVILFFSLTLLAESAEGGQKVFFNSRAVSSKSGSGKSVTAFPDVCHTPPDPSEEEREAPIPGTAESDAKEGKKGPSAIGLPPARQAGHRSQGY
ncbi:MAG: hypothetical protein JW844_05520 [Candidatus Omnitrophica bacterium]|nr:hypothetical protein [Candidatus Omnitrophota bacterium]